MTLNSNKKKLELDSLHVFVPGQNTVEITISSLRMTGFDVMKLLKDQTLVTKNLTIDKSKIALLKSGTSKSLALPFDLKKIDIDNFQCTDLSVSYKDKGNECRFITDLGLNNVAIDPSLDINKTTLGSVDGNISGLHYSGNNYHNAEIKNIEIDSKKEWIQIHDINITPQLGKYEFGKKLGHQADWMQAYISKIDIVKPDFDKLLHQKLFA